MKLRLGACGWSYPDWRGTVFASGTKDERAFYATEFDAVEIDSTFYHMPSGRSVDSGRRRTPEGFVFCPRLLGEIAHERMLEDSDELVSGFLGVISRLGEKLGPTVREPAGRMTHSQGKLASTADPGLWFISTGNDHLIPPYSVG